MKQQNLLIPSPKDLWFVPLGGSGEIGMNLNLYGHDGSWLMVDLGITFNDRLGIEIITPNPEFIAEQYENLVGLVLTHAHEDHIGAVPYLWQALQCPIYATRFTATVLKHKLKEMRWGKKVPIIEVPLAGTVDIAPFQIEFITLTHSIPEPNAIAITTPQGTILHTGDWKIDDAPLLGSVTNKKRLQELGDKGILALVCDSTNVFVPGTSGSESEVKQGLTKLIQQFPRQRIALACFASNVARIQTIIEAGAATGRQVALVGRSLEKMVEAARQSGYLKDLPPLLDAAKVMRLPSEEALLITTGSQGEPRSALARIAARSHPEVTLEAGDVIIFSSRVIPGNEKAIFAMQNLLVAQNINVITTAEEEIHVSGHPAREELKQMYSWVQPEVLVPVHGELRHMMAQATLGEECGIKKVIVPQNGHLIQLAGKKKGKLREITAGRLGYDGNRLIPLESKILQDRARLAINGAVMATLVLDKTNRLIHPIQLTLWGLTQHEGEQQDLEESISRTINSILSVSSKDLYESLKTAIRRIVNERLAKKPLTDVHIVKMG